MVALRVGSQQLTLKILQGQREYTPGVSLAQDRVGACVLG
jgi:hypothetical protein